MYINNDDLVILKELEVFLWNKNFTKEYLKLWGIIENLEEKKEKANKRNWQRIKEKRLIDKNYARKKEKN